MRHRYFTLLAAIGGLAGLLAAEPAADSVASDTAPQAHTAPRAGLYVDVTVADACQAFLPEITRGLAAVGVTKPPPCPSRSGVVVHQPERNQFFLRDSVKATTDGTERIIAFSVTATYRIDDSGHPIWTEVQFRCEQ